MVQARFSLASIYDRAASQVQVQANAVMPEERP
jgi:hypothetical protein